MGLAAVAVLIISVAEVSNYIYRRRAERLFNDIRQLQVGKSTFEDARAVILRHGGGPSALVEDHPSGCSPAHCGFVARVEHDPLPQLRWDHEALTVYIYDRFLFDLVSLGLQDWECRAVVWVNRGLVTYVGYEAFVRGRYDRVLGRFIEERSAAPEFELRHWGGVPTILMALTSRPRAVGKELIQS